MSIDVKRAAKAVAATVVCAAAIGASNASPASAAAVYYCSMSLAANSMCVSEYGYGTIYANAARPTDGVNGCETLWDGGPLYVWNCTVNGNGDVLRAYPGVYALPVIYNPKNSAQLMNGWAHYG